MTTTYSTVGCLRSFGFDPLRVGAASECDLPCHYFVLCCFFFGNDITDLSIKKIL